MSSGKSKGELGFQRHIIDHLVGTGDWIERKARTDYNREHAVDRGMLDAFLADTQPETYDALKRAYGERVLDVIIGEYEKSARAKGSSQIETLRNGIDLPGQKVTLLYKKPASDYNPDLLAKYGKNRLSVMEEVVIDDSSRIDLVLFVNGFAWACLELKYTPEGSDYHDAIGQWIEERDHKNRLLEWQVGSIVDFAMDDQECHMTTRLNGESTRFIPFNRGRGEGINQGAGNPVDDGSDDFPTHYVWDDVLSRDSVIEILTKFVLVERKREEDQITGKVKVKEAVVFPRYHQRDAVHKMIADIRANGSAHNYLIQHSAGSGKTFTISWMAHRLSSLHGKDGEQVFDSVIVATDRKVVDRQLQAAIKGLERTAGLVKVMDDTCTSADLSDALSGKAKIIVTTIQKFLYVDELAGTLNDRRFAVIIDEAHNSTAGRDMAAIHNAVGGEDTEGDDAETAYAKLVRNHGKRPNMSVLAFTATPKARTLKLFGSVDPRNPDLNRAFHSYSMKQAIEEGFILDVLANYIEYRTYFKVCKAAEDDPAVPVSSAKREVARAASLDNTNINQRVGIIVEHFRSSVMHLLGGRAKAMVVTGGRAEAVKYRQALQAYVERHGYGDIHALVAFSGKVDVDDVEYSERGMNGFSDSKTADYFDTDDYNVLLVANKYQVGFDQPKLCAMYVMRKLRDVDAVQTLSRLNRPLPGKATVVLDFVNTCHDMEKAFSTYYTGTVLSNTVTVSQLTEQTMKLEGYNVIDEADVRQFAEIVAGASVKKLDARKAARAAGLVRRAKQRLESMYYGDEVTQAEFRMACSGFIRLYEFMSLASSFGDAEMEKLYGYVRELIEILDRGSTMGVSIKDKINFERFHQQEVGNTGTKGNPHPSDPMVKLPGVGTNLTPQEVDKLSVVLAEVNARAGGILDNDVAARSVMQVKDLLMKDEGLARAARANSEQDFELAYFDRAEDALYDGLAQNKELYGQLMRDDDLMRRVLGIFVHEVYRELHGGE